MEGGNVRWKKRQMRQTLGHISQHSAELLHSVLLHFRLVIMPAAIYR